MWAVTLVRAVRLLLVLVAVALAAVPLFALLDLARGGTGLGLCPGGIAHCRNPYTAAPELSVALTVSLLGVVAGIRATALLERRLRRGLTPSLNGRR